MGACARRAALDGPPVWHHGDLDARNWPVSQAIAILAYYTPENNATLYREAERWLERALDE